jgi:hypothetical protein
MKAYVIRLEGQGDTVMVLVGKETWEWVTENGPLPQIQIDLALKDDYRSDEETDKDVIKMLNSQKGHNDKALSVHPEFGEVFTDLKSYTKFAVENKLEIIEEYEGYIY